MRNLIFFVFFISLSTTIMSAQQFDLVLEGGRAMDPETGLDAVRNVGIRDGKIARISSEALSGRRIIHAGGLVVAPGFIDLPARPGDGEPAREGARRRNHGAGTGNRRARCCCGDLRTRSGQDWRDEKAQNCFSESSIISRAPDIFSRGRCW
jgi:hypothetical protein